MSSFPIRSYNFPIYRISVSPTSFAIFARRALPKSCQRSGNDIVKHQCFPFARLLANKVSYISIKRSGVYSIELSITCFAYLFTMISRWSWPAGAVTVERGITTKKTQPNGRSMVRSSTIKTPRASCRVLILVRTNCCAFSLVSIRAF
jgi:hypothetical protein